MIENYLRFNAFKNFVRLNQATLHISKQVCMHAQLKVLNLAKNTQKNRRKKKGKVLSELALSINSSQYGNKSESLKLIPRPLSFSSSSSSLSCIYVCENENMCLHVCTSMPEL